MMLLVVLAACLSGGKDTGDLPRDTQDRPVESGTPDTGADPDTYADDTGPVTGDTSEPTDTSDATDTSDPGGTRRGRQGREGEAKVTADGWDGTEDLVFLDEAGEDVCRIRYDLVSVAVREDCLDCIWAFDLEVGAPAVVAESDVGCIGTLGLDEAAVAALAGTVVSYGYIDDYFFHGEALVLETEGAWLPVTYPDYDPATGSLRYAWTDAYVEY